MAYLLCLNKTYRKKQMYSFHLFGLLCSEIEEKKKVLKYSKHVFALLNFLEASIILKAS